MKQSIVDNCIRFTSYDKDDDPFNPKPSPSYEVVLQWFIDNGVKTVNRDDFIEIAKSEKRVYWLSDPFDDSWIYIVFVGKKGKDLAMLFKMTFM